MRPVDARPRSASTKNPWIVLVLVVSSTVLTGIGLSIMSVTFGEIAESFPGTSPAQLSWIANLFTIVSAATLIPAGVLADRVGRRQMLLIGVALFVAGSVLGALAPNPTVIMVARSVQAVGSSAFSPAAAALLIASFPPERLAQAIGVWAVTGGVSSAIGPSLGGLVVGWGGWQWAFWINLPIGFVILLLGPRYIPRTSADRTRAIPDPAGALLVMLGVSAITLAMVQDKHDDGWGWLEPYTLATMALGVAILGWFVARCRRHPNPLLELELFRLPNVRRGVFGTFVIALAWFCVYWGIVQYTMREWGWSPFRAGVSTAPVSLFSGLVGVYVGRLASVRGHRQFIVPGCLATIATAVFFWVATGSEPELWTVIVPGSIFLGLSTGLVFPSFIATTLIDLPDDRHAVGSSLNLMVQRVGTTFGVALAITFLTSTDVLGGLHRTLAVGIGSCIVCLAIGLRVDTKPGIDATQPV